MKFDIVKKATTAFHKTSFKVKERSPEILLVVGTVSIIGSVVTACRATIKARDILDDTANDVEAVHTVLANPPAETEYTEEDSKKDLTIIYAKTGLKLAKTYAPTIALLGLGLGCMFKSHNILQKRNIALAAAYTAIDKGFKEYRSRVVDRFGEEVDQELRYDIKAKQIVEEVKDEETGKVKKVKKTVKTIENPDSFSIYAVLFDESSREWRNDPAYTLVFLNQLETWANERCRARGHLILNEVYDAMGVRRTTPGCVVGWTYDRENPNKIRFIGLPGIRTQSAKDYMDNNESRMWVDFNVDGVIYDRIEQNDYIY